MRRTILAIVVTCGALAGCGSQPQWEPARQQQLFTPTSMRIHPVFTQLRDWTGDAKPDGVDALIEAGVKLRQLGLDLADVRAVDLDFHARRI